MNASRTLIRTSANHYRVSKLDMALDWASIAAGLMIAGIIAYLLVFVCTYAGAIDALALKGM